MSRTVAVYPIVAGLGQAYATGNALTPWFPTNRDQQRYLENLAKWEKELGSFSPEELETIASHDADEINAFLKAKGFDIQLQPFEEEDDYGTASVMKVLAKWLTPGTEADIHVDGKYYAGVNLEDDISFTQTPGYPNPVVHIHTESGDVVHMTVADDVSLEGLDLLAKTMLLTEGNRIFNFGDVTFPMVDHDSEVDISFFKEMFFKGEGKTGRVGKFKVIEAKQQTKFQMNHLGAKAESAAAFSMGLECMRSPGLVIDKPFYVWMTRKGLTAPYFAGCIDSSDWKNPGSLDSKSSK